MYREPNRRLIGIFLVTGILVFAVVMTMFIRQKFFWRQRQYAGDVF